MTALAPWQQWLSWVFYCATGERWYLRWGGLVPLPKRRHFT